MTMLDCDPRFELCEQLWKRDRIGEWCCGEEKAELDASAVRVCIIRDFPKAGFFLPSSSKDQGKKD